MKRRDSVTRLKGDSMNGDEDTPIQVNDEINFCDLIDSWFGGIVKAHDGGNIRERKKGENIYNRGA